MPAGVLTSTYLSTPVQEPLPFRLIWSPTNCKIRILDKKKYNLRSFCRLPLSTLFITIDLFTQDFLRLRLLFSQQIPIFHIIGTKICLLEEKLHVSTTHDFGLSPAFPLAFEFHPFSSQNPDLSPHDKLTHQCREITDREKKKTRPL